ncbi:DUF5801 repeats-in-toxin domain-containing protein, partial [Mangrovicoccus sp. HB161399]|uniref:DUF5801 repeats-in-toxin domain-containing protein n=1 Tax=Mangrovicoccus sp. HB161399 TaxID=2720392 RepID=UPI001554FFA3
MADESVLVVTTPIRIDETAGVDTDGGKNEIPVADLSAEMSAAIYGYLDTTYLATLGDPDNVALLSDAVSTPDGFDNLSWTDAGGELLSAEPTTLLALDPTTNSYEPVTLTTDPSNDNVLIGMTASGNIAFIAVIDSTSGTSSDIFLMNFLAMEQTAGSDPDEFVSATAYVTIAASESFTDFSAAPPGANDWLAFEGDEIGGAQILVTSSPYEIDGDADGTTEANNGKVNTSTIGIGKDQQSVKVGDTVRVDIVDGAPTGDDLKFNYDTNDADAITFGNFLTGINEIEFGLVQTGGNAANTVDVDVQAFFVDSSAQGGTSDAEFFANSVDGINETPVALERVEVQNGAGTVVAFWTSGTGTVNTGDPAVQIGVSGSTASVVNLIETYSVRVFGAGDINRIEITNDTVPAGGNKTFDIGAIELGSSAVDTDPLQMDFHDSAPGVAVIGAMPTLETDDTDTPGDTSTASIAGIFQVTESADGPLDDNDDGIADAGALVLAMAITGGDGTDSGLNDSLSGDDILLRANAAGTLIEGYLAGDPGAGLGGGTIAFTISLDLGTMQITQQQDRSVEHDDGTDPDESASPALLAAAGLITLTATATDKDGESAGASLDIGHAFAFRDDGPSVSADGEIPTLVTDDTNTPDDTAST